MKLTNKLRLPDAIIKAIMQDSYTKGEADISVTELLTPPQLRRLKQQHAEELEEDASDRIYSLMGQSLHTVIERAAAGDAGVLVEATLYSEYEGWKIKGQADHLLLTTGELLDFKMTSVNKIKDGQVPREWVEQTNIYRRLLQKEKGIMVASIAVIAILRDWSKNKSFTSMDYPQSQVVRMDVPLWSAEKTDDFIAERMRLHQAEQARDCSDYDTWARPDSYAVMKRGAARAVRVFNNVVEAEQLASTAANLYVEKRPGIAVRCQNWCPVSQWCPQWQADPRRVTHQSVEGALFGG